MRKGACGCVCMCVCECLCECLRACLFMCMLTFAYTFLWVFAVVWYDKAKENRIEVQLERLHLYYALCSSRLRILD